MLLFIHFYTVADYLYLLQQLGQLLEIVGPRAILYLAAAVSDFYLPEAHLVCGGLALCALVSSLIYIFFSLPFPSLLPYRVITRFNRMRVL